MSKDINILVVEDERLAGKVIMDNLKTRGYNAVLFKTAEEALFYFKQNFVDILILDCKLPGMSGEELFLEIKKINPLIPVIFMTAYSSVEKAVNLLKNGAYNYLVKPIELEELNHNIDNIAEKLNLIKENKVLKQNLQEKFTFENYIFDSDQMQRVISLTLRAADSDANILITGTSGTGKEVIANITHNHSKRKAGSFIKVNLSTLPETLIEAELFGVVKGAYTGSMNNRTGKFEEAHNGTLFLDEIGDLSLDMQVKLLRAIQEREIVKLGSNNPIRINIRLITATNKNLQELIKLGKFREDLYFRLNVINIELPPLRKRKEDIPRLIDLFIKKYNKREKKSITAISKDAQAALMKYNYIGNIRELENIIERGVVLARGDVMVLADLPFYLNKSINYDVTNIPGKIPLPERLAWIEKNIILDTLKKFNNNQSQTAKDLGISESGLRYKLQALKIRE